MQVVRALFHHAGWVVGGGLHIVALGLDHGLKSVHALVNAVGGSQLNCQEILVDIREGIVKIQQVFMQRAITHDCGRESFSTVGRVKEGECQPPLAYILLHIVDVVKF